MLGTGIWWIECSKLFTLPSNDPIATWPHEVAFGELGLIRAQINPSGTLLTWDADRVLNTGADTMLDRMDTFPTPITLAFFKTAWAVEEYQTAAQARARVASLAGLSETPTHQIVEVKARNFSDSSPLSPILHGPIATSRPRTDFQNLYRYDAASDDFLAEHIGPRSSIASLMGPEWTENAIGTNAAPNSDAENFDPTVTARYRDVMDTGDAAFDEVCAVTTPPDAPPMFVTWHRLLEPWNERGRRVGCRVTTSHVSQAFPEILSGAPAKGGLRAVPFQTS